MLALPKLKKKHCYDIIHFHATTPAFFYSLMFNQDYMPSVFTYGNPALGFMTPLQKKRARALLSLREIDAPKPVKLANLLMEQRLLKRVSMTVTVSLLLKQRIVEFYDLDPRRVRAVHPGVQTEFFKPGIDCSQLRERHGLLDDNLVVLCVAKLAPYKGQLRLIKLIPRIIHAYPRSKFVFVGPMNNTRYASELRALVDSKGLQRNVIFTGAVKTEDLPKYYNLANLFVLLSVAEGLPSTLLEAMSCGCPIIASAIPQNREVAVSGGEAIFVNPFDESAIVEAICKLLGDAALRATLGKAARETAVSWFDWKIIATRILKTYEEILAAF
jgi:glycosyltransferase involved in cell wall biosynthesis